MASFIGLLYPAEIRYNDYMNTEKAEKGVKYLFIFVVATVLVTLIFA
jgi:hypothetical protein